MNRQKILAILLLILATLACDDLLLPDITPSPTGIPATETPIPPTPMPPLLTASPTRTPLPRLQATPLPTRTLADIWLGPGDVLVHPDGGLYSGDKVSFQVQVRGDSGRASSVPIAIQLPGGQRLEGDAGPASALLGQQAQFEWDWDTTALVGTFAVTVTLDPTGTLGAANVITSNDSTVITLTLGPASERPAEERGARWTIQETDCCRFHFVTRTAVERDWQQLVSTATQAVAFAESKLGEKPRNKLDIYLISRVLGHGGFASDAIAISYLDRNYAASNLTEVLRHETTHILHRQLAGNLNTVIAEGLAVWSAEGHYKPEPIGERAAALRQLDRYIPLRELARDFYSHQHEIGYLEAASLVEYLVEREGLDQFEQFLRTLGRQRGDEATSLDRALRAAFSQGLDALESEWLDHLRSLKVSVSQRNDLEVTLAYYDTVRRYEQEYDPSAYYRQIWMPDLRAAESSNIVADWVRHPRADENVALETLLIAAHDAQIAGDWPVARQRLASVNAVLDTRGVFRDPLASQYLALVRAARASGWEPQSITLTGETATMVATRLDGKPTTLTFTRAADGWRAK